MGDICIVMRRKPRCQRRAAPDSAHEQKGKREGAQIGSALREDEPGFAQIKRKKEEERRQKDSLAACGDERCAHGHTQLLNEHIHEDDRALSKEDGRLRAQDAGAEGGDFFLRSEGEERLIGKKEEQSAAGEQGEGYDPAAKGISVANARKVPCAEGCAADGLKSLPDADDGA